MDDHIIIHDIDNILDERGSRYGKFIDQAKISQSLQATLRHANNSWDKMQPDQREALEMIACKLGRIVNGDPDYIDSRDDIAGYAKLVADRLRGVVR